ncbi:sigma-54 interaction domain-containing protein [Parasphingorhabdus sp.]|uniref:sigma-54 interaction domain-containing protein n=1 Tax=Parasphingorhabdus sp. TaxID=2709688 RepID=UPI003BB00141
MEHRPNAIGSERKLHPDDPALHLIGDSAAIEEVRCLIRYAAATTIPVMITGPSGCGKEVVAKALHRCSARSDEKFVGVNCGAIPRDLLESELFGHEKGSFTGAIAQRKGQFEDASNGTLFLDEIGDMPFDMQVKLLRVLEEKQIERIGGSESIAIDTRIISATHQNLDQAIAEKRFREDLFYRLSVFPIDIPALKDRREDIAPLIRHFIAQIGGEEIYFSPEAMDALENYGWPGNARELRNIVERAVVLFPGVMISDRQLASLFRRRASNAPTHHRQGLPSSYAGQAEEQPFGATTDNGAFDRRPLGDGFDLKKHLMQEERKYLLSALRMAEGVVAEAAHLVSLRRTTFVEKMRRHKIVRKMAMTDHRSDLVRRE